MKCKDFEVKYCAIFDRIDRVLMKYAIKAKLIASLSLGQAGVPMGR